MKCKHCGTENAEGTKICVKCGKPLGQDAQVTEEKDTKSVGGKDAKASEDKGAHEAAGQGASAAPEKGAKDAADKVAKATAGQSADVAADKGDGTRAPSKGNGGGNGAHAAAGNGKRRRRRNGNARSNGAHAAENGNGGGTSNGKANGNGAHAAVSNGNGNGKSVANGNGNGKSNGNGAHAAASKANGNGNGNGKSNGAHAAGNGNGNGKSAANGKGNGAHAAGNGTGKANGNVNGAHAAVSKANSNGNGNGKSKGAHAATGNGAHAAQDKAVPDVETEAAKDIAADVTVAQAALQAVPDIATDTTVAQAALQAVPDIAAEATIVQTPVETAADADAKVTVDQARLQGPTDFATDLATDLTVAQAPLQAAAPVGDPVEPEGRPWYVVSAIVAAIVLVLGAMGYGAWRLRGPEALEPGDVVEETEGDEGGETEAETKTDAETEGASTYTRPTEPWDKEGNTSSGGGQGSQSTSSGASSSAASSSAGSSTPSKPSSDEKDAEPEGAKPEEEKPEAEKPEAEESPEEAAARADGSVPVRASVDEYSWSEIGALAGQMEACATEEEALAVAKSHNLVDESGTIGTSGKVITLDDGTTLRMRLVGVFHDRADTTTGRAALSFISENVVARHTFGDTETVEGGWSSSSLRSWMANSLLPLFPDELEQAIRPVYKRSNRSMSEVSPAMVSDTYDTLWAPSIIELCGPIDWPYQTEPEDQAALYNSVFNQEGTQYAAFAQMAIDDYGPNAVFSLGDDWWLRSCSPRSGRGRFVGADGDPSYISMANEEKGVVVGFCL